MKPFLNCPFCSDLLDMEIYDYHRTSCKKEDHTFLQRNYVDNENINKLTVRVGAGDVRYYIVISFETKTTTIWSGRFNTYEGRIILDSIPYIDFTLGIEATKNKIKTYLTLF